MLTTVVVVVATKNLALGVFAGFDYREPLDRVVIDANRAHVWDLTGAAALDTVVTRLRRSARTVELAGLNPASQGLVARLSTLGASSPAAH